MQVPKRTNKIGVSQIQRVETLVLLMSSLALRHVYAIAKEVISA